MEQYAIKKFAESLEILPRAIAENAGAKVNDLDLFFAGAKVNDKDLFFKLHWLIKLQQTGV